MSESNGDSGAIPRVDWNEDGEVVVRADGRLYPAVEQTPTGDGVTGVSRCPHFCEAETHTHSVEPGLMGHRVSHCYPEKAEDDVGYFLLKPHVSLFNTPLRWWKEKRNETRQRFDALSMAYNMGLGPLDSSALEGPGLLDVEGS